jgi:hypothetical protein
VRFRRSDLKFECLVLIRAEAEARTRPWFCRQNAEGGRTTGWSVALTRFLGVEINVVRNRCIYLSINVTHNHSSTVVFGLWGLIFSLKKSYYDFGVPK